MKQIISDILKEEMVNFVITEGSEQRSVGDMIEFKIKNILMGLATNGLVAECVEPRSKKSIEDVTLIGHDGVKYYIDPKSHNVNSKFSMPNLTSVEKLRKLLSSNDKELVYVFVSYEVIGQDVNVTSIDVKYVWELSFDMLRIGSLGKGQLQISDMNKELKFTEEGKQGWFNKLKETVRGYHNQRIKQIEKDKLQWL
jgi:hypothetical protein